MTFFVSTFYLPLQNIDFFLDLLKFYKKRSFFCTTFSKSELVEHAKKQGVKCIGFEKTPLRGKISRRGEGFEGHFHDFLENVKNELQVRLEPLLKKVLQHLKMPFFTKKQVYFCFLPKTILQKSKYDFFSSHFKTRVWNFHFFGLKNAILKNLTFYFKNKLTTGSGLVYRSFLFLSKKQDFLNIFCFFLAFCYFLFFFVDLNTSNRCLF